MGYVIDELLKLGKSQIGVAESPKGSNRTKYGNFSDTPISKNGPYPWYNGKKNGVPWCAVGINWEFMMVLKPLLGSYDKVRSYLNYPKPADNCAAACPYMYKYLKDKFGEVAKNKGVAGDVIFFNTSSKCGHVGRIYEVKDGKYKTIEYNKGDKVDWGSYSVNSTKIYAVIHIDFSSIEPKEEEPTPDPEPLPHPTPEPEPVVDNLYKVVNIKTFLAIRTKPNANGKKVGELYNDAIVSVTEQQNGWGKITGDLWVYMSYLKKL